jgi:hypothetical protein
MAGKLVPRWETSILPLIILFLAKLKMPKFPLETALSASPARFPALVSKLAGLMDAALAAAADALLAELVAELAAAAALLAELVAEVAAAAALLAALVELLKLLIA